MKLNLIITLFIIFAVFLTGTPALAHVVPVEKEAVTEGRRIHFLIPKHLRTGELVDIVLYVEDATTGEAISGLDISIGFLRRGPAGRQWPPLEHEEVELEENHLEENHWVIKLADEERAGYYVVWHTFDREGRYDIFAEFEVNGEAIRMVFWRDVETPPSKTFWIFVATFLVLNVAGFSALKIKEKKR